MLFLRENNDAEIIIESTKDGKKNYYIEGIFLQSEIKNRNGRLYPKAMLAKEVARYTKEMINENKAVGELSHPATPSINYDRVSHKIISLKENGNNWIGKAKIVATPMGAIVKSLMDENIKFGVSSRGMGSLKESNGINIVQDDYHLATAGDIVSDPSAPDAFVNAVMEQKNWVWSNGVFIEEELTEAKKTIQKAKSAQIEEVSLKIFENFLSKL